MGLEDERIVRFGRVKTQKSVVLGQLISKIKAKQSKHFGTGQIGWWSTSKSDNRVALLQAGARSNCEKAEPGARYGHRVNLEGEKF